MEFSWFDRKLTYFTAFLNYDAPHLKKNNLVLYLQVCYSGEPYQDMEM